MISSLKPYSEMKDSGDAWLGEVPAHWEIRRTKTLLAERSEKEAPDEPLLAATQTKGVVRKEQYENRTVVAMKDLHLLKLVRIGDFVVSLRSFQGGIEHAREQGIISPAYTILYPIERAHQPYLAQVFKSKPYVDNLSLYVTGIRQGQNVDYEKLARSRLALPPLREQFAITRFLDYTVQRIQRYISTKEKLIALLEEQKKTIIQQAVTGQIDVRTGQPYGAYRPAGLVGVSEIPKHWEQCRLRNVVSVVTTGSRGWSSYAADTGPLFIRVANLNRGSIQLRFDDVVRLDLPNTTEAARSRIRAGDLLVSVTAYIGSVGVAADGLEEAYVSQHVARCQPRPGQSGRWLAYGLLSELGQSHGQLSLYGGTKDGLSLDDVKNFPILVPPACEKEEIVRWVDDKLASVAKVKGSAQREIAVMGEYRARLVADVVTGKLDVRQAAGTLPVTQTRSARRRTLLQDVGGLTYPESDPGIPNSCFLVPHMDPNTLPLWGAVPREFSAAQTPSDDPRGTHREDE